MTEGDVYVLHASASLGTAIFERHPDGTWHATQHFRWEASNPDDDAGRRAFWDAHGWLANSIPRGPNVDWRRDREFSVDLARFRRSGPLRIAAGLLHVTGTGAVVERWPATLEDDAASLPVHRGDTSRGYVFRPETWDLLED